MNNKSQLDMEVFTSSGFWMLLIFAWGATMLGYLASLKMDLPPFPLWQILVVLLGEVVACFFWASTLE